MKRIAAIVLVLYASSAGVVAAQPKRPGEAPVDPYAEPPPKAGPSRPEAPVDPYADPASRASGSPT
jgi:hypothetical protein